MFAAAFAAAGVARVDLGGEDLGEVAAVGQLVARGGVGQRTGFGADGGQR